MGSLMGLTGSATYRLLFVREEGLKGITSHAFCMFRAREGLDGLTLLKEAVTSWCTSTAAGHECYLDSNGDLNIADLALVPTRDFLAPYGIEALFIAVNEDHVVPFDTHLCTEDPDEATELASS